MGALQSGPRAFILFRPKERRWEEQTLCNAEAFSIFSFTQPSDEADPDPAAELIRLCQRWQERYVRSVSRDARPTDVEEDVSSEFIDVFSSGRRTYGIRCQYMGNDVSTSRSPGQNGAFLFLLHRLDPDTAGLSAAYRRLKLNRRERDIVRLLMDDCTNKEIAARLGLSLNTIKGYLKILMRRLGVGSRAGIVSLVLGSDPAAPAKE